jgi:cell division protein ZapA (FtsZ GTPase activity inhibitor)
MSELSIKVSIAGRLYPLTIETSEEEGIRNAAKIINDRITYYKENYAVKDNQDLLAMAALEIVTELQQKQTENNSESIISKLNEVDKLLSDVYKD